MLWVFLGTVVALLVLDLGVLHRKPKIMGIRDSLYLTFFYVVIGVVFGGWIWMTIGADAARDYYTAYIVEKSLSLDNVFVISIIFSYFNIPRQYQHRVLLWGVIGVVMLRGIAISLGDAVLEQFHWVLYLFGAFLVWTGGKMLLMFGNDDDEFKVEGNKVLAFLHKHLHVTEELHGQKFFVRAPSPENPEKKINWATPLFVCLVMVECADLIFAVDSIPAVFAITQDSYIVYTSNILAILGLRALYFMLAAMVHRFHYLKFALALVLVFIGAKIFLGFFGIHLSALFSFVATLGTLTAGVVVSLAKTREPKAAKTE
ncbi:TerC/Alx family metal homeostasis membrane protein [bacterium]|nr:TerC/Alx family metal homeostasis membrane protein [bacterium]